MLVFLLKTWKFRFSFSQKYSTQIYHKTADGKNVEDEVVPFISLKEALLLCGEVVFVCFQRTNHILRSGSSQKQPRKQIFSFLKIISVEKLNSFTPANTTLCCSDQNSYCIPCHEYSILVLSMRYRPFVCFYFFDLLRYIHTLSCLQAQRHVHTLNTEGTGKKETTVPLCVLLFTAMGIAI